MPEGSVGTSETGTGHGGASSPLRHGEGSVRRTGGEEKYSSLDDIYEAIGTDFTKQEANQIINSIKICDPAVGSGHFLVSALNEIIAIKSELKVLLDRSGKTLRDYHVEVVNDELTAASEQIAQAFPAMRSFEGIGLLDPDPGQVLPPPRQFEHVEVPDEVRLDIGVRVLD